MRSALCGRPTKRGSECRLPPVNGFATCLNHLTAGQREEHRLAQAAREAWWTEAVADPAEPACWSWPLPEADVVDQLGLLMWHHGRCAICGRSGGGALVVDHDHATALIRGALCRSCNTREAFRGGVFTLYQQRHPAAMLGVSVRYWSVVTGEAVAPPAIEVDRWQANPLVGVGI